MKDSCMKEGLITKEPFKPAAQNPKETAQGRPKHDGAVKRSVKGSRKE
ncbi:MAG: hypothetical protein KDE03_17665 [Rhodobacteraceae bacterium]|nr:hypothetical protein [Paracoccaceae bacterium]